MSLTALLVWASLGMLATAYAHRRLARFTVRGNQLLLHVVLTATGILVGLVMMERTGSVRTMLSFVAWFGAVHIPAACILFLKAMRGSGET